MHPHPQSKLWPWPGYPNLLSSHIPEAAARAALWPIPSHSVRDRWREKQTVSRHLFAASTFVISPWKIKGSKWTAGESEFKWKLLWKSTRWCGRINAKSTSEITCFISCVCFPEKIEALIVQHVSMLFNEAPSYREQSKTIYSLTAQEATHCISHMENMCFMFWIGICEV